MKRKKILLVNPNRMLPPIGPIGLEYVAAALERHGYEPVPCDLTFAEDWRATLTQVLDETAPFAIGVSVRNVDDAYFASQDFVLETTAEMVRHMRESGTAPVVLGGIGFSVAPEQILGYTGADHGIAGEGEWAFPTLLDCLAAGGDVSQVPGAVFRTDNGDVACAPLEPRDLALLETPGRRLFDNLRYFNEGGQAGVETQRGCPCACIYCPEPVAKGRVLRHRSPDSIAEEFAALLEQGIDALHLCDSEFNLSPRHAHAVCDALVRAGVAERLRWYAYASPHPFDKDLAKNMARAGCVGIDFGVDHGDEAMLRSLGRTYGVAEVRRTVEACRDTGIAVMFDMLFGGPGETRDTLARAIGLMRELEADRVGLSCGVRVYPNTPLARSVLAQGPLADNPNLHGKVTDNDDLIKPIFYLDANLGLDLHGCVTSLAGGDKRFLHADPNETDGNYNYNDNSVLVNAISAGERGAYWDILRRLDS